MARSFHKIKKKKRIREDGVHNETIKVRRGGTMKEEGVKTDFNRKRTEGETKTG